MNKIIASLRSILRSLATKANLKISVALSEDFEVEYFCVQKRPSPLPKPDQSGAREDHWAVGRR